MDVGDIVRALIDSFCYFMVVEQRSQEILTLLVISGLKGKEGTLVKITKATGADVQKSFEFECNGLRRYYTIENV